MKFLISLLFLFSVSLIPTSDCLARQAANQTISVDVDLVNVIFTVFDRKGKFITNLDQQRFTVFEDNHPQRITNFSKESNLPLTIALLIDTSGSIRDKLRFEQEAAIEFFYSTLKKLVDKALVISFDSGVDLVQDYTDDPEVLADAVKRIRAGGGTALYDAVHQATQKLIGQPGRKILILISDGDDNSSRVSLTETVEHIQRNDVSVFAISTNASADSRSREQDRGDKVLKKFAEESGGKVFFPFKLQELTSDFQNISEELRSQYTLAYRSTNSAKDGTFRKIRIAVGEKNYQVRARTGYYTTRPKGFEK